MHQDTEHEKPLHHSLYCTLQYVHISVQNMLSTRPLIQPFCTLSVSVSAQSTGHLSSSADRHDYLSTCTLHCGKTEANSYDLQIYTCHYVPSYVHIIIQRILIRLTTDVLVPTHASTSGADTTTPKTQY